MDKRILQLRKKLDEIDEKIYFFLEKRMEVIHRVGKLKSELDLPIEDVKREKEIIERLTNHSEKKLTNKQLIRIFQAVFKSSKKEQEKINYDDI